MARASQLAAKKARLEVELSTEVQLINDQYVESCRKLAEVRGRPNRALTDSGGDWAEKFRACTADTTAEQPV